MSRSRRAARTGCRWSLLAALVVVLTATACSSSDRPGPTGPPTAPSSVVRSVVTGSTAPGVGPLVSVTDSAAVVPMFPAVVALSWLDGPDAGPAIRVQVDGLVRWQGSAPGEAAEMLTDGAYRWVGADGSMVGCAARPRVGHAACVGIDPSGNTAITGGSSAIRVVYGPSGSWIGDYQANGSRAPGARPTRTLAQAQSSTGVDLAALVDFATRQPPFAGGITGDPHLITAGGVRVTSQQLGEFEARSGDPGHEIQIRTEAMPYRTDVAEVSAVVIGTAGHHIEVRSSGDLFVDGRRISSDGRFRQLVVPGGVVVGRWPPDQDDVVDVVVLWPGGASVAMAADSALGLTIVAHLPMATVAGLFGTEQTVAQAAPAVVAVTPAPDIPDAPSTGTRDDFGARAASATPQTNSTPATVASTVQSWRVQAGDAMFVDAAPAPVAQSAAPPMDAGATLAAEKFCAAAGMTNAADVASCVFDVARTGDAGFVAHEAELASSAEKPAIPASLAARWPGLELGTQASPTSLALDSQVDVTVPSGSRRVYLVDVRSAAPLSIRAAPCAGGSSGGQALTDAAAIRMFDGSGHPVSARRAICGRGQTDVLAAGSYYLVLAGGNSGPPARFKLRVTQN